VRHCLKCGLTIVVDALASVLLFFFLFLHDMARYGAEKGKKMVEDPEDYLCIYINI
jgi:hypothetical protein